VVSGSIRFMQIFAGVCAGDGASNESVVVENDDFRFYRSLPVFQTFYIGAYMVT